MWFAISDIIILWHKMSRPHLKENDMHIFKWKWEWTYCTTKWSLKYIYSKITGQCLCSQNAEKYNPVLIDSPSTVENSNGMHDF